RSARRVAQARRHRPPLPRRGHPAPGACWSRCGPARVAGRAPGGLAPIAGTVAVGAAASPWSAKQRLLLAALLMLGVVGLAAGYVGASGTLRVSRHVACVNVGA